MQLPTRDSFLPEKLNNYIRSCIASCKEFYFLPFDVYEGHEFANGRLNFTLTLYGVTMAGEKLAVQLNNIDVFVDVLVPKGESPGVFAEKIMFEINEYMHDKKKCYKPIRNECIKRNVFHHYNNEEADLVRVYFDTTFGRLYAIDYLHDNYTTYSNDQGKNKYHLKVMREYGLKLAAWNKVVNYSVVDRGFNIPAYKTNISNFTPFYDEKLKKQLQDEKWLVCTWDIESYSHYPDGKVATDRIYKNGELWDCVFMISMTFHWYQSTDTLLSVTITDLPVPKNPRGLTINCANQVEIIKSFADVIEAMRPDFITGFNDGEYDFPFIVRRAKEFNLIEYMKEKMSCLTYTTQTAQYNIRGTPISRTGDLIGHRIKLAADITQTCITFDCPGYIAFDTRSAFRRLQDFKAAEYSNLNYFLKRNKLESKEDMPYQRMFNIYNVMYQLCKKAGTRDWYEISKYVDKMNEDIIAFKGFDCEKTFTKEDIKKVLDDCILVDDYCRTDAKRCQELCVVRNIITNAKEVSLLSFTPLRNYFYNADAMKMINLVIHEGHKKGLVFNTICDKHWDVEYSGAHVFKPKYGLLRDTPLEKLRNHFPQYWDVIKESRSCLYDFFVDLEKGDVEQVCDKYVDKLPKLIPLIRDELPEFLKVNNSLVFDRPITGLDFSSLYPSITMAYNLSPETVTKDPVVRDQMIASGHEIQELKFTYKRNVGGVYEPVEVTMWAIKHNNKFDHMGLYPTILKALFDTRSKLKKVMHRYVLTREFMNGQMDNTIDEMIKVASELSKHDSETIISVLKEFTGSVADIYKQVAFMAGKLHAEQLALKVFMNTFYGVTGFRKSAFFELLICGAITAKGQYNIKLVESHVVDNGFNVMYGDTDSVYVTCPDRHFAHVDRDYIAGNISREEYWEHLVRITMKVIGDIRDDTNKRLFKDNGTRFLRIAYEEVGYPALLAGKKKYIMVPHENSINLHLCKSPKLKDFHKEVFIRGLELKKRGSSEFLKTICLEVCRAFFDINAYLNVKLEIISKFDHIIEKEWNPDMFIKRDRFKGFNDGKPAVRSFMSRMEAEGRRRTIIGERFDYVLVKRPTLDANQRRIRWKTGDKYEYPEELSNGEVIDIDYYVEHEIIGQFARFIVCCDEFQVPDSNGNITDKYSIGLAKKYLIKLYKRDYVKEVKVDKDISSRFRSKCSAINKKIGAGVIAKTSSVVTKYYNDLTAQHKAVYTELLKKIDNDAKAASKESRKIYVDIIDDKDLFLLEKQAIRYRSKNNIHVRNRIEKLQKDIRRLIPEYCIVWNSLQAQMADDEEYELDDDEMAIVDKIEKLRINLIVEKRTLLDRDNLIDVVRKRKELQSGSYSVETDMKSLRNDIMKFMSEK